MPTIADLIPQAEADYLNLQNAANAVAQAQTALDSAQAALNQAKTFESQAIATAKMSGAALGSALKDHGPAFVANPQDGTITYYQWNGKDGGDMGFLPNVTKAAQNISLPDPAPTPTPAPEPAQ